MTFGPHSNLFQVSAIDLFPVSPETIKHFHQHLELKTVYIPHPDTPQSLRYKPYTAIKLVLLTETRAALRSRGYSADLSQLEVCDPDSGDPTVQVHRLTLSRKDEHSITIGFTSRLIEDREPYPCVILTDIEIESGSGVQLDSVHDVHWFQHQDWASRPPGGHWIGPDHQTVKLSLEGAGMLTVDIGLEFTGGGVYVVRVDVQSNTPPAPPVVELTVKTWDPLDGLLMFL